jgi:hypothetical protein
LEEVKEMNEKDKKDPKKSSSSSKLPMNKSKDKSESNSGKRDHTSSGKRTNKASGKRAEEASGKRANIEQNTPNASEEDSRMVEGFYRNLSEASEIFSKPIITASILEQSKKFQKEQPQ